MSTFKRIVFAGIFAALFAVAAGTLAGCGDNSTVTPDMQLPVVDMSVKGD